MIGLSSRVVGPPDAPVTVVLMHGFGAPDDDLVPLSQVLAPARYVFPAAPLALGGPYGGNARAWWLIDFAKIEAAMRDGKERDQDEVPDGLAESRAMVMQLLDALPMPPGGKLVLGGFSQGSMLALDVALHREAKVDGLILMSSTLVAAKEWLPRMSRLAGVPVVMSHGQRDPLLAFSVAETLRDKLREGGAVVDWVPFPGAHEIPRGVLAAVDRFIGERAAS